MHEAASEYGIHRETSCTSWRVCVGVERFRVDDECCTTTRLPTQRDVVSWNCCQPMGEVGSCCTAWVTPIVIFWYNVGSCLATYTLARAPFQLHMHSSEQANKREKIKRLSREIGRKKEGLFSFMWIVQRTHVFHIHQTCAKKENHQTNCVCSFYVVWSLKKNF